jgi:hypothetical protein
LWAGPNRTLEWCIVLQLHPEFQDLPLNDLTRRERSLKGVDRLFYRRDIRAVGVDTIVKEFGISKKTLYQHFRSKGEMIEAYLSARSTPMPVSNKPLAVQIMGCSEWIERTLSKDGEYRGARSPTRSRELGRG